jgi:serine/threonine-protein kinase
MAEVFLAVAQGPAGFNKLQVIKRLRPNLAEDPELRAMFLDEARLAARLNHRNVVQTNEVDVDDGQYFMAMEYLDGQPLHRVLGRRKQDGLDIPLPIVARVVSELLIGLHYAHELTDYDGAPLGIVHRDVSPQNVFVTYDGQVKVVDFGIAKAARRAVETATGVIKGKLAYMAPEQAFQSSSEIDRRVDVFSVGVMLWEMLAGRRLWCDLGDPAIIAALLEAVPPLAQAAPEVDPALCRIVDRALALDREERFASAAALRNALLAEVKVATVDELGAFMDALFREQREEIKALLSRQVDLVAKSEASELLELDRGSLPRRSLPPPPSLGASETPPPSTVTAHRERTETTPLFSHARPEVGPVRGRAPWVLGATVLVAAGLAVYLATTGSADPVRPARALETASASAAPLPAPPAPAPTAAPIAPSSAPAGAFIAVHLAANPTDARILVDGAALPANPFEGKFVKDGAVHRLSFEARGFQAQSRLVVFDKDLALDVALSPRPKAEPAGMKPDPYR